MAKSSPFFSGVETVRLVLDLPHIPGEWWIEVKKELTNWETKRYQKAGVPFVQRATAAAATDGAPEDMKLGLDMAALSLERAVVYVVDWNLTDHSGKVNQPTRLLLQNLKPDVFEAIDKALDGHVKAGEDEKKARTGAPKPGPDS